jgi:hypothetical protein
MIVEDVAVLHYYLPGSPHVAVCGHTHKTHLTPKPDREERCAECEEFLIDMEEAQNGDD